MRGPGDVHEDGHPPLIDQIEQPLRRDVIDSDRVGPERLQSRQVVADALPRGKRLAFPVGGKRTIGQPPAPHSLFAAGEQLPVDANATIDDVGRHAIR